jgi:SMC interacting uncharacterized protein involved in chromosome segregation
MINEYINKNKALQEEVARLKTEQDCPDCIKSLHRELQGKVDEQEEEIARLNDMLKADGDMINEYINKNKALNEEITRLNEAWKILYSDMYKYRVALEKIMKHYEVIAGTLTPVSVVYNIAQKALGKEDKK